MVRPVAFGTAAALAAAVFGASPLLALLVAEVVGIATLATAPRERR